MKLSNNILVFTGTLFFASSFMTSFWAQPISAAEKTNPLSANFHPTSCAGSYRHHLQGICTDEQSAIFWSFTTTVVKTDTNGKVLKKIDVKNHHGDLCFHKGKLYVAVNFGPFNDPAGKADSWVYVYRASDLSFLAKHKTPRIIYGAGGIGFRNGHFFVVGGLPAKIEVNYIYEYDSQFRFVKEHQLKSGQTRLGIQTATFADGQWWFGCYGTPKILLRASADLKKVERFKLDCSLGIVGVLKGRFLVAKGPCDKSKGCRGLVVFMTSDKKHGLVAPR